MSLRDTREVVDWMCGKEGEERAEWVDVGKMVCWIWWRRPEEWAEVVAGWVRIIVLFFGADGLGQRLTFLGLGRLRRRGRRIRC